MRESFEDFVGKELDALHQGALFLCAGEESAAEQLILDAVTRARYSWGRVAGRPGTRAWLSRALAQEFLARSPRYRLAGAVADRPPESRSYSDKNRETAMDPDAHALYRAAGSIPHAARPALWLGLIRRWSYQEVATTLRISSEELHELLRYRATFIAVALGGDDGRAGSAATG